MRTQPAANRRSIRLRGYDYTNPGAYFITLVTDKRRLLFGRIVGGAVLLSGLGHIAEACWCAIPEHFPQVELDAFVVMPNHVHGILTLHDREAVGSRHGVTLGARHAVPQQIAELERFGKPVPGSLATIVRQYKGSVTRLIPRDPGDPAHVWQRNYYERIIRDDSEWKRIHLYIESNPARWETDTENRPSSA